jgi:glycosyltransferase involved in cell wall biosynthesis
MSPEPPLVSIVICNYNYERYIDAAVDSALSQTYPRIEVVVVDDGSTDGSLSRLTQRGQAIQLVAQANGGQINAYNTGYAKASGDYLVFLDADDVLDADTVAQAMADLDPRTARVHFRLRLINAQGQTLGPVIPRYLSDGELSTEIKDRGHLVPSAPGSGNLYSRAILQRLMPIPIDPHDRHGADFYIIYGASLLGLTRALAAVRGGYRVHSEATAAESSLVFGNAATKVDEYALVQRRAENFKHWIQDRTGMVIKVPLVDFGVEKQSFAKTLFAADTYGKRVQRGVAALPRLTRAIWMRRFESLPRRAGLIGWALCVILLPRPLALPLARYVCNPASRT